MSEAGNVIRGHKANLSNPNTSDASKEHSKEVSADDYDVIVDEHKSTGAHTKPDTIDGKDAGNVIRGSKASITNPNVSEEAKEAAKEKSEGLE